MTLQIKKGKHGCTFFVHVQPRSSRDQVTGLYGDALKIRLTAPPVAGKANQALQKFLAKKLATSPANIEILTGHTSHQKRVRVAGISPDTIRALLETK
jgi:uncharacterized protein (TIGR00251 family)